MIDININVSLSIDMLEMDSRFFNQSSFVIPLTSPHNIEPLFLFLVIPDILLFNKFQHAFQLDNTQSSSSFSHSA